MRKLLVGGNWKQNGTVKFAKEFPEKVLNKASFDSNKVEVVVSPAAIHLLTAKDAIKNKGVFVAA
jgi:triosephosphate isomerase